VVIIATASERRPDISDEVKRPVPILSSRLAGVLSDERRVECTAAWHSTSSSTPPTGGWQCGNDPADPGRIDEIATRHT
jgi:hypothetical protein